MKRNLITQIKNEWRDNMWLVIELMIVSVAVWFLAVKLAFILSPKFEEKGFEVDNVYRINISSISSESPSYSNFGDDQAATDMADLRTIMARIRRSPYVETAAFSSNALPYQYNYAGNQIKVLGTTDSIHYNGNVRMGSPEIVRVIKPKSIDNESLQRMEQQLRNGGIYIAKDMYYTHYRNINDLVGKKVMLFDTVTPKTIAGIIHSIRRTEYESITAISGTILMGIDENDVKLLGWCSEIAVRVKPGMGKKFEEEFLSDPDMRKMRNMYLTQLTSMKDVRASTQYSSDTDVRLMCAGIVFLLVIIFIGLLGTFWFRIRQRAGEIALRKTCGATSSNVFRRIISEGLLLFTFATIPAIAIETLLYIKVIAPNNPDYYKWYPVTAFAITVVLMIIMIIVGTVFPARRAMHIEPAIALKEE